MLSSFVKDQECQNLPGPNRNFQFCYCRQTILLYVDTNSLADFPDTDLEVMPRSGIAGLKDLYCCNIVDTSQLR